MNFLCMTRKRISEKKCSDWYIVQASSFENAIDKLLVPRSNIVIVKKRPNSVKFKYANGTLKWSFLTQISDSQIQKIRARAQNAMTKNDWFRFQFHDRI